MKKYFLMFVLLLIGIMGTLSMGVVSAQEINKNIVLEATATANNQTLKINKYFANAYTVDWGDGTIGNLTADITHTYATSGTYTITLSLSGATRWIFQNVSKPLVPTNGTSMTGVKIINMPSLADGFGDSATSPGDRFFYSFNRDGKLTSLPTGSFDTSYITTVGNTFFAHFNYNGQLTSLPVGSFDISHVTTVGNAFFGNFNRGGQLVNLPSGSFNTSKITIVGDNFFSQFNLSGALTSLPTGSFDTSHITTVGNYFFYYFNSNGVLTNLSEGSFDTSKITIAGIHFFSEFNNNGALTSLPTGSFILATGLTTVGNSFFRDFNRDGALTSLPGGSFDTSKITTVGDYFFTQFNLNGALISLSTGSFRLATGLTMAGNYFFHGFNNNGSLTDLPVGSFDTSHIITVETSVFADFNYSGAIESLPVGSFDTSNVTVAGDKFFSEFNNNGAIMDLPSSFTMNSTGASQINGYYNAFNSPNYTINKKVSDLISGVTVPLDDRNTFSDNQPGRCGVHENWLVNPASNCKTVIFETNSGILVDSQVVDIDANEKVVKPTDPTKTGNTFTGWYSDEDLTNLFDFSTVITGDTTLYAKWETSQYTLTIDVDGTLTVITGDYGSPITPPANPTKNGYKFIGWEPEIPATMPAEDMTIKAKWEKINSGGGSSGGGGGGGGGGSSSSSGSTSTGSNTSNQPTGSGANNSTGSGNNALTGTQNDQTTTGTNVNEPEGTGNNAEIQTGSQIDTPDQDAQENDTDTSNNNTEGQSNSQGGSTYSEEFQQAYEFAKGNGITTMPTIEKADMNGNLTRIAMAKMLSQYAMNVLGQKPANIVTPKFNDVSEQRDEQYDNGVTLAYQLGIMGQNMPNNNFRPDDEVTRAEFATALSRMLYSTLDGQYKSTPEYYTNHMKKLKEKGIITKADPKMKELRGYVMIMLMRSAK